MVALMECVNRALPGLNTGTCSALEAQDNISDEMVTGCTNFLLLTIHMIKCTSATIVYPRVLESREQNGDMVLSIHRDLTLHLERSSVLADNVYVDSSTRSGTHRTVLNGHEIQSNLYHDKEHHSSLTVTRSVDGVMLRGVLNHGFTITPALVAERSYVGAIPHKVNPIVQKPPVGLHAGQLCRRQILLNTTNKAKDERIKNNISFPYEYNMKSPGDVNVTSKDFPPNFTVELWLVTSKEYRTAFTTNKELLIYLATALNAVALRFTSMNDPRINFQLNGLTIDYADVLIKNKVCSKFKRRTWRFRRGTICGVDVQATLDNTRSFINESMDADIVYFLTSEDLVWNITKNNRTILDDVLGMAYIGGVCTPSKVGVGEDNPRTYSGITTMAHEISHLLGSFHDGEHPRTGMHGYPDSSTCSRRDGYLMGDLTGTSNVYRLSSCTKEQIQYQFRHLSLQCINLGRRPNKQNNNYPGEVVDPWNYCRQLHPDTSYVWPEEMSDDVYDRCKIQCCWDEYYEEYGDTETYCEGHWKLEGMSCGENKTCRRGVCGQHNWDYMYETWRTFEKIS